MKKKDKRFDESAPGGVKSYRAFTDDFVESRNQETTLSDDYVFIHRNIFYRFCSGAVYGLAVLFAGFYTRAVLHVSVENKKVLKECSSSGFFLYGNHTQPIGDAFAPVRYAFPRRINTIMSPANLGIPVLGKILPILGGIPIPDSLDGMREFMKAVKTRVEQGRIMVIYPEAHVWPWCDFVRPFPETSFQFPVMCNVPAFCMTTTYQKRRHGKKPRITVYLDGPFYPQQELGSRKAKQKLHDEIYECMCSRSRNSTFAYIRYEKDPKA